MCAVYVYVWTFVSVHVSMCVRVGSVYAHVQAAKALQKLKHKQNMHTIETVMAKLVPKNGKNFRLAQVIHQSIV